MVTWIHNRTINSEQLTPISAIYIHTHWHTHTHTHTHALTQKHTHTCTHTPVFGHSALTLMPCGRNSSAIPNTHMDMPNLAMVYAEGKREASRWRRQQHWTRTPWQHYSRGHSGYCTTQTYHNGAGTRLLSCWVEDWCSECAHWHFSLSTAGTALSWMWQNEVAQWVWSSEEYDTCMYIYTSTVTHTRNVPRVLMPIIRSNLRKDIYNAHIVLLQKQTAQFKGRVQDGTSHM